MKHDREVNQALAELSQKAGAEMFSADFWVAVRDAGRRPSSFLYDTTSKKKRAVAEAREQRLERNGGYDLIKAAHAPQAVSILKLAREMVSVKAESHPDRIQNYERILQSNITMLADRYEL